MTLQSRQSKFVDRSVQGQLAARTFAYWALCMLSMFTILAGTPIALSYLLGASDEVTAGELALQAWRVFWPAWCASGIVLPFLIWDVIRVSHRFAGPILRLRNSLRLLAEGHPVAPLQFRQGDFWSDLAQEFNRVSERMRQLEQSQAPALPTPSAEAAEVPPRFESLPL